MILAIDPSIENLGWAMLKVLPIAKGQNEAELIDFDTVICHTGGLEIEERIEKMIHALENDLHTTSTVDPNILFDEGTVVIEKPQLWGAFKSVASMHSGALLSLHILTGALFWWGQEHFLQTMLIPVSTWKGQLPKRVTQKRMETKYNVEFKTDDEADAVGIGTFYITGRL
jgi:hypothetical protein